MPETAPEAVSESSIKQLESFAEKGLQATDKSELIAPVPSLIQRGGIYLISGALFLTLLLLYFGRVHVVVDAEGTIVPEGDVRPVEALQGGVVKAVLARPGDRLPAGAAILKLDVTESGINLALQKKKYELDKSQLESERATLAELNRILANPRVSLDSVAGASLIAEVMPAVTGVQSAVMKLDDAKGDVEMVPAKKQRQTREMELIRQKLESLEKNQKSSAVFLDAQEKALEDKRRQLQNYRQLAEKKLISPLELSGEEEKFRTAENQQISARQRFDDQEVEIANQKLRLAEANGKIDGVEGAAKGGLHSAQMAFEQALTTLRQQQVTLQAKVEEAASNLDASAKKIDISERQISLASIAMPVAGTIADLKTKNTGELVGAGTTVATIVPEGVPLFVNADVPNKDIGFVKPGIEARVKIDAYPFEQFGTVPARVETVLPALGGKNFPIRLRLLQDHLDVKGSKILLFPGLTAKAELLTSKQRLLDVLLSSGGDSGAKGKK